MDKEIPAVRGPFKKAGKKNYYFEVNRKRKSLGTDDPEKAKKLVDEIRQRYRLQLVKPEHKQEPKSLGFEQFQKSYLKWAESIQPTKTFKANRLALDKLVPVCKGLSLSEIGAYHLDQMISREVGRGLKVGAVNCYIRHAKTVFSQAVKWGHIKEHPFKDCKQLRDTKKPPKALDKKDIEKLFSVIDDCYDELVIKAYLVTGRSRSELVRLQWDDVEFDRERYYITRTKTHLSKWYPMGAKFREILESLGPEEQGFVFWRKYHRDTITHKIKDYLIEAGLGKHSLHHLRHSFSRLFLEAGGDLRVLQDLLGHAQYSTTEVYASIGTGHLSTEIERVRI